MAPSVDPAIVAALGLDPDTAKMSSHGGSGFASSFKLSGMVTAKAEDMTFFIKTGSGRDAEAMFKGEYASLEAIYRAVPDFCSRPLAHGAMSASPGRFFLATEFLDLGSGGGSRRGPGKSLAVKLAQLHKTPAPTPEGFDGPMYGFPVPTCCGPTVQDNDWRASWAEFYADKRLRSVLTAGLRSNGPDAELEQTVEAVAARVVPRLLGDGHLQGAAPVVVHGDLWSGNHGRGRFVGRKGKGAEDEVVVYDPSCVYGHSEYDLGIMRMFGGFGSGFWDEYSRLVEKSEPAEEFEDRLELYELYHHLNHFSIFGSGYRGGAMNIMKRLIAKYG